MDNDCDDKIDGNVEVFGTEMRIMMDLKLFLKNLASKACPIYLPKDTLKITMTAMILNLNANGIAIGSTAFPGADEYCDGIDMIATLLLTKMVPWMELCGIETMMKTPMEILRLH